MRQIRLRKLRRRLGLYEPPAPVSKPMDPASVLGRRRVFETLPVVPDCPAGWQTGAPDFVIFGAQKSGTTWWFRLIEQHPGVVQPKAQRPELHFFDRLWAEWPTKEAIASYHRYFPRPDGSIIGEKTPEYLSVSLGATDGGGGRTGRPRHRAAARSAGALCLRAQPPGSRWAHQRQ